MSAASIHFDPTFARPWTVRIGDATIRRSTWDDACRSLARVMRRRGRGK